MIQHLFYLPTLILRTAYGQQNSDYVLHKAQKLGSKSNGKWKLTTVKMYLYSKVLLCVEGFCLNSQIFIFSYHFTTSQALKALLKEEYSFGN